MKPKLRSYASMPAKLVRPVSDGVYKRTRLFDLIDRARKRSVVWITAPAGSGKTTLVASYLKARRAPTLWYQMDAGDADPASFFYCMGQGAQTLSPNKKLPLPLLTPEYGAALPVFTANYFRSLFERMKPGGVIVFDNYQDAGTPDAALHDLLAQGLDQIPKRMNAIVVSREEPPAAYARYRANERLSLVGWDALRLTERETIEIANRRDRNAHLSPTALKALHQETQGWVAGIVLLTERVRTKEIEPAIQHPGATQPIFDYFAAEIFRRGDAPTREFLLKTAFLPQVSPILAEALTGEVQSEAILKDLARRNFFTLRHGNDTYEYHPLFRAFLQSEIAKTYSTQELSDLKRSTAALLAQHRDGPAAIALLLEAQQWSAALELIVVEAPLLARQGRTLTIETWLATLPAAATAENPWAHYWNGVSRMAFSPMQARKHFEHAFALFENGDDASPLYLAWSGIIESFILEHDNFVAMIPWLDRYRSLPLDRKPPSPDIKAASIFAYVMGLSYVRFDDPELPTYVEQAEKLLQQDTDINRRFTRALSVILYNLWAGNGHSVRNLLANLAPLVTTPETTPLARLHWYLYKTIYAGATGALEEAVSAVNEAALLADVSGIHLLDFHFSSWNVWNQLVVGKIADAHVSLQQAVRCVGNGQIMNSYCHLRAAAFFLHEDDLSRALAEGLRAVELSDGTGFLLNEIVSNLTLAHVYIRQNNVSAAWGCCEKARVRLGRAKSKVMDAFCSYAEAITLCLQGKQDSALTILRNALSLTKEIGLVTPSWCHRQDAATLYAMALDADIETEYVREVIRKTRLPPPPGIFSEKWPWHVRVYTLGRFDVFVEDAPLVFSGRAQNKPLELLRALASSGEHGTAREKLAQMLWPDTDGDMAKANFDMTLHRLRKLLGEESIQGRGHQIVLNPSCCWLDVWAFNQLIDRETPVRSRGEKARRLLELYRGPFLDGYENAAVLAQRRSLQSKFVMAVDNLGQGFEQDSDPRAAIEVYLRGIEVDPLAELLYRRLMGCHCKLGRTTEALAVYQRCRETLAAMLGIKPTEDTEKLHAEIRDGCHRTVSSGTTGTTS